MNKAVAFAVVGLVGAFAASSQAAIILDVGEVSPASSGSASTFTLPITLQNTESTAVSVQSFNANLDLTPSIPAGNVTLTGVSNGFFGFSFVSNPPVAGNVTNQLNVVGFQAGSQSISPGQTVVAATLSFQLAANSPAGTYNITFGSNDLGDPSSVGVSSSPTPTVSFGTGFIKVTVPEPTTLGLVAGAAVTLFRRRK